METNTPVDGIEPDDTTDQNGDGSSDVAEVDADTEDRQSDETVVSPDSESGPSVAASEVVNVGDRRHNSARSRRRNRGR